MNPAASERKRKENSPEKFCPNSRCLWSRASGPCPRHQSEARNQLSQDAREGYGLTCPESHAAEPRGNIRNIMRAAIVAYLKIGGSDHAVVSDLITALADRGGMDKLDGDVLADILSQLH